MKNKRIYLTYRYDVTDLLPRDLEKARQQAGNETIEEYIREFFSDTAEILNDADWGGGVTKVEIKEEEL